VSSEALGASRRVQPRWATAIKRVAIIGGVVLFLLFGLGPLVDDPPQKGPVGSSFGTVGGGVAALADLAKEFDYRFTRRTTPMDEMGPYDAFPIDASSVLVVLDAELDDKAATDVSEFVNNGGRLVASVDSKNHWTASIPSISEVANSWRNNVSIDASPGPTTASIPSRPEIQLLQVEGSFAFASDSNPATDPATIAERADQAVAVRVEVGEGEVILLADASMLTNRLLGKADNAAFALELLENGTRPIVFAESPHGFGASLGPTGLPSNVRWFLIGLVLATLLLMITRSKRNGPPEIAYRELAPARSTYLLSLAASIDRVGKRSRRFSGRPSGRSSGQQNEPRQNESLPDSETTDQLGTR
jgi:hypothetical protein